MNRQAKPSSPAAQEQLQHRGLHRDVQRAGRLVGDHQPRVERQRPGDADALPLAAGQLVRVAAGERGGQLDRVEQLGDPGATRGAVADAVQPSGSAIAVGRR